MDVNITTLQYWLTIKVYTISFGSQVLRQECVLHIIKSSNHTCSMIITIMADRIKLFTQISQLKIAIYMYRAAEKTSGMSKEYHLSVLAKILCNYTLLPSMRGISSFNLPSHSYYIYDMEI